jgi:D-psicose/D-tagatose/L-ribulose 3-epimerase
MATTRKTMRFGLNLLLYTAEFSPKHLDLIPKVAAMGYDGVELPFTDIDAIDPAATRKALEKAGIGATACAVLFPGQNFLSAKVEERNAARERIARCIEITAALGGDTVAGPLYAPVGLLTGRGRTADEWKYAVEGFRNVAELAAKARITLAIEPLNRFETYFVNTCKDALALVKEVGHPSLTLQFDTFHANIEEKNTPAAIRLAGAHLGHFHVSESDRGVPGTGQVPWKEVFKALKDIGYGRWVTIESFARGILELCAAAAIWRDIYETPDALARDGLKFMRELAA